MTAALEPTWTTTSFFPKTTPLPHPDRRRLNPLIPDRFATTTASRAITSKTLVVIPLKTKKVAEPLPIAKVDQWVKKRAAHFVAAAVAVADAAITET